MIPSNNFPGANKYLETEGGETKECGGLATHVGATPSFEGAPAMTSEWNLTDEERAMIASGAKVYLTCYGLQVPVMLSVYDNSAAALTDIYPGYEPPAQTLPEIVGKPLAPGGLHFGKVKAVATPDSPMPTPAADRRFFDCAVTQFHRGKALTFGGLN